MGVRETALNALQAVLATIDGPEVAPRNSSDPEAVPAGGLIILRDGDPGEPTMVFSPTTYCYEHQAEVEVWVQGDSAAARDSALDAVLSLIPPVIAADTTLQATVDYAELREPEMDFDRFLGAGDLKVARVPVILHYDTTSPLT